MSTLRSLKESAKQSAIWRGHNMTNFKHVEQHLYESVCKECGKYMHVNTHPAPNQIDIGGDAVANDCITEDK